MDRSCTMRQPDVCLYSRCAPRGYIVLIVLLLPLFGFGCIEHPELPPTFHPSISPTARPAPSPGSGTSTRVETNPSMPPGAATEAQVIRVIDGDTIRVSFDDAVHTVRYVGIDAPERDEPLGPAATAENRAMLADQTVYLERDVSNTDEFGRLLRYVYLADGTFVNGEMVRRGLAEAKSYPPDVARQATLEALEGQAQAGHWGLWQPTPAEAGPVGHTLGILAVDKKRESVDLINRAEESQDLTGWVLVSEKGDQACQLWGKLEPGEILRIWALEGDADRGGLNCGFEEPVWYNSGPDRALLYAPDGRLVDAYP